MATYSVNQTTTPEQQAAITNAIMASITHGETWSVSSPAGDTKGASIASQIMGAVQSQLTTTSASSAGANAVGVVGDGTGSNLDFGTGDPHGETTPATETNAPGSPASRERAALDNAQPAWETWLQNHMANYGLIALGIILAIGALLISQKSTIVNIGKQAAQIAAVAA